MKKTILFFVMGGMIISLSMLIIAADLITQPTEKYPVDEEIVSSYQKPVYSQEIYAYTEQVEYPNGTIIKPEPLYRKVIDHYDTIYIKKPYIEYRGERYYNFMKADKSTAIWNVDKGDRNPEFPACRKYEQEKGVCREI